MSAFHQLIKVVHQPLWLTLQEDLKLMQEEAKSLVLTCSKTLSLLCIEQPLTLSLKQHNASVAKPHITSLFPLENTTMLIHYCGHEK